VSEGKEQLEKRAEVLRLHLTEGLGIRPIARKLSMSRNTVRRILGKATKKSAPPPRTSMLSPFEARLSEWLKETPDMRAPAVLERLRPLGYTGGVSILRDRLRQLRPRQPKEAFLTLRFAPGEVAQVDWADFGYAIPGCPRRVSAFVMALAYSRYLYLEFTLSQAMGTFLRCMERGLGFFGGVCEADVFDNMKTVVVRHTPQGVTFNSTFLEYARTRGFAVRACNVRRANEKGRVERPIGFIRERFWPGRRFQSLLDLNAQAATWRDEVANRRVHEATGKVPALVYLHEEKAALKPLPTTPFDTDDVDTATVTKLFRVRFDRNLYSVPPHLVGQSVLVRGTSQTVSVFLGPKCVATHERCWSVGEDVEDSAHRAAALSTKPRAGDTSAPPALEGLGEVGHTYLSTVAAGTRSLHREVVRLTFLAEVFGASTTADAMGEVMRSGHVGAEYVEYVLRHRRGLTPAAPPLKLGRPELDSLSFCEPDMSVYDALHVPPRLLAPGSTPHPTTEERSE
jgi:transposase